MVQDTITMVRSVLDGGDLSPPWDRILGDREHGDRSIQEHAIPRFYFANDVFGTSFVTLADPIGRSRLPSGTCTVLGRN